jgi:hypothetical protein
MWQSAMVAVLHLLLLAAVLFVLRRLQVYISAKFAGAAVHCPTQLAADGQYEAPPRGWIVGRNHWNLSDSDL